ncbi:MAG: FAD-dependent oxidoreductase, partial [Chloroflexota bacterium]|nr:FAD-dependent oxidoreductase [Chloroflexota bacterium]
GVMVQVDGQEEDCDVVVVSAPSAVFKRLVPELPAAYVRKLDAAGYQAACCMLLELDRKLTDMYWLNIADEAVPFTGVIEQTNFVPPEQYGGSHLVYLSRYLEVTDPIWTMDQDALFQHYLPALRRINPAFDPAWVREIRVFRERAAQPIVPLNYSSLIPEMRTPLPNIYLANTTQIYPEDRGTNYSIKLGGDVATLINDDLRDGRIAPTTRTPAAAD